MSDESRETGGRTEETHQSLFEWFAEKLGITGRYELFNFQNFIYSFPLWWLLPIKRRMEDAANPREVFDEMTDENY